MLLGKEFRTMWDYLSPTGSGDWLFSSGRLLHLDQQWWVGKPHRLIAKTTKQILLTQREENPLQNVCVLGVQPPAPQAAFPSLTFVLETSLQRLHAALQMLQWHLDFAGMSYLPVSLSFPAGLPSSSRSIWALLASPPRASNNIYQLQFSPFSNISSGPRASERPVRL